MISPAFEWLETTFGLKPGEWPAIWSGWAASLRESFRIWAEAHGLNGILAELGFWFAIVAMLALLWRVTSLAAKEKLAQSEKKWAADMASGAAFMVPESVAKQADLSDGIGRYLVAGSALAAVLVFGLGGWAWTTELAGAVLAQGTVTVESKDKKVQHPTGGVVSDIRVKDGDLVKSGDLLLRLDETVTKSNLSAVTAQLDEIAVKKARLLAEQSGTKDIVWPQSLIERASEPELATIMGSERGLFDNRKAAREGQRRQLEERIAQLTSEIDGMKGQIVGKQSEIKLQQAELDRLVPLEKSKFVPLTKMTSTRRDLARLKGEQEQLVSSIAQAKQKISETKLQILGLGDDLRSEASKELREIQAQEADLREKKVTAADQLTRIEVRAPQSGIVHNMTIHTVGGVVGPGETLMMIVPEDDPLVIEAKVSPSDVDHVRAEQAAYIRFPAFDQRSTPEFTGHVVTMSADLTQDTSSSQPGPPYYLARIMLNAEEQKKLGGLRLVPGMPAEVHIQTPKRTAMSYLVKPLVDQIALAFKER